MEKTKTRFNICIIYGHWYVPFVVITIPSFPHSYITGFLKRVTRPIPLVQQELPNIPEQRILLWVIWSVHVAHNLLFGVSGSLFVSFRYGIICPCLVTVLSALRLVTVLSALVLLRYLNFICYLNRFFTFDYSLWDRGRHIRFCGQKQTLIVCSFILQRL